MYAVYAGRPSRLIKKLKKAKLRNQKASNLCSRLLPHHIVYVYVFAKRKEKFPNGHTVSVSKRNKNDVKSRSFDV